LESHVRKLERKYVEMQRVEARAEHWRTADAEIVLVGYGIVGRILKAVVEEGRREGLPLGLLRPVTLFPFPTESFHAATRRARLFVVVELSTGQLIEDVRLAVEGRRPVALYGRVGGNVPSCEEVLAFVRDLAGGHGIEQVPEEQVVDA
jgi:pyruvate/2-oxoacid:ferredoxin oxidoreductase alpha subunit